MTSDFSVVDRSASSSPGRVRRVRRQLRSRLLADPSPGVRRCREAHSCLGVPGALPQRSREMFLDRRGLEARKDSEQQRLRRRRPFLAGVTTIALGRRAVVTTPVRLHRQRCGQSSSMLKSQTVRTDFWWVQVICAAPLVNRPWTFRVADFPAAAVTMDTPCGDSGTGRPV